MPPTLTALIVMFPFAIAHQHASTLRARGKLIFVRFEFFTGPVFLLCENRGLDLRVAVRAMNKCGSGHIEKT